MGRTLGVRFQPSGERSLPASLASDAFIELGASSVQAARLSREPVSLLLVEVDDFALIDRTHGAQYAEHVMATVTMLASDALRPRDAVSRRSASQLAALLPGTPLVQATEIAGRIAAAVRQHVFLGGTDDRAVPVRVSVAAAAAPIHGESYPALVAAAERALHRSGDGRAVRVALDPAHEPLHPPLQVDRFIGRADQLRMLVRTLDDAVLGRGQVAVVHGEVGVGCSTLVAQLAPEVAVRGGAFVSGAARRLSVRPPYGPWADVIEGLSRLSGPPAGDWHELQHLVPSLAAAGSMEAAGGSQFRLLEELSTFIRASASVQPLVLVLDDMQWADEPTWDAIEHVLPKLLDAPVLCVVIFRDSPNDPVALDRRQRLARTDGAHDVAVSRLTRDEVKRWVEAAFNRQEVGREFLSFVYRNTEGNPLFVDQLLRALVEERAVWHTGERWEWRPVSELQIAADLDGLVVRRLGRFPARAQVGLAAPAVLGREFTQTWLVASGAGSETDVAGLLADALEAGIVAPSGTGSDGEARYAFAHERLAEVIIRHLAPQRVRRAHERAARALETLDQVQSPACALEIAVHLDLAGVSAGAYAAALRAADHAERLYAHATASELLRLAGRNAGSPAELAAVRTRLATLAELAGQYDEAEELCDLAIEWYAGQGDHARSLTLRASRERLRSQLGQPARRTLENLLALDREGAQHGLAGERVAILTLVSQTYGRLGDRASAERIAGDCVAMAEGIGDPALLADSLNRLAITMELVDPERAKEIYARALALYAARGDYRGQARIHNNIGIVAQLQGNLEEADRELATAIALARTAGMPDFWGAAALNLGVMTMKSGGLDRARELLQEALSLFAAVKNSELQLYALYNLAHLERERGEFDSAAELYEVAVSLAQRIGQLDVEAGALGGRGLCLTELGRAPEAADALRAVEARVVERNDWFQGRELIEILGVRVALGEGRVDEAVSRFERAVAVAEGADLYTAAWLTAECATLLRAHAPAVVARTVAFYAERVGALGYHDLTRRYAMLAAAAAAS